jgi:hypothetical protein
MIVHSPRVELPIELLLDLNSLLDFLDGFLFLGEWAVLSLDMLLDKLLVQVNAPSIVVNILQVHMLDHSPVMPNVVLHLAHLGIVRLAFQLLPQALNLSQVDILGLVAFVFQCYFLHE